MKKAKYIMIERLILISNLGGLISLLVCIFLKARVKFDWEVIGEVLKRMNNMKLLRFEKYILPVADIST